MNTTVEKVDSIIHDKLIPIQAKFKNWQSLANRNFRFDPHTFKKAVDGIQEVINIAREIA